MKNSFFIIFVFFLNSIVAQQAEVDSIYKKKHEVIKHPLLSDDFILNAGLFFPSKTLKIRADGSSPNEEIEFNKAFDLDDKETTFALNFLWRFSKSDKWSLGIEYFGVKNNSTKNIDKEIKWENIVYPVGAEVSSKIKLNLYRIFFGRVISRGNQHELGAGLGFHAMDISSSLEGEAYIDEATTSFEKRKVELIAPLPNIGLWYFYAPTEKLALSARIDWFGIKVDNISGSLWNVAPGIKYQLFDHLGIGLNYRYFATKIEVDKNAWRGNVYFDFKGPLFTISTNF